MAKILVADDNSNIQKMVGLALKDQGIDVVAVGNGEAAVRKISDVRPDLVLADVFMPVRNGYEVCKFVKDDTALSHIPVILLVGAFDPLDEQEAQRVGADGVLKKPFVPPDPLISMVKSALAKNGVIVGMPVPAPVEARPEPPPPPRIAPPPPPPPAFDEPEEEPELPAVASRPAPFSVERGSQPVAFGSLLDSAGVEEDAVFAISPNGPKAPERNWGPAVEEAEEEEPEASKSHSWRVSSLEDDSAETPAGQTDWREAAFANLGAGAGTGAAKPGGEWSPSVEKNSLAISEAEAAELAKKNIPFVTSHTAEQRGPEDWSRAIGQIFPEAPGAAAPPPPPPPFAAVEEPKFAATPVAPPPPVLAPEPPPIAAPVEASSSVASPSLNSAASNSWMAGAVSPWEAELQRASQLSTTWDAVKTTPAALQELPSETASTQEAVRETVHEVVQETVATAEVEPATLPGSFYQQDSLVEASAAAAPEAVPAPVEPAAAPDDIVAKVLAKMSPEVLQAVTREILKPVVEAMVKEELSKKQ
ncbi:MAG TPA: response regulator [Dongiaceae bacterium]|nr:response regulator [Dongiaceae bacterium]